MTPFTLRDQLRELGESWQRLVPDTRVGLLERTVAASGSPCWAQALPRPFRPMAPKQCFVNAARLVGRYPRLTYVEGFAARETIGFPLHHAWAVDEDRQVVDPTWDDPAGCAYWGVPFDRDNWQRWSTRPLSWSLFDSGRGVNLELLRALNETSTKETTP